MIQAALVAAGVRNGCWESEPKKGMGVRRPGESSGAVASEWFIPSAHEARKKRGPSVTAATITSLERGWGAW